MKPVLIGMINPYSDNPKYALYPTPIGSAGHRLYTMLSNTGDSHMHVISYLAYAQAFERYNLIIGKKWDPVLATYGASELLPILQNRDVIICGKATALAFKLTKPDFSLGQKREKGFNYWVIPHTSGLNREYNDPKMVKDVGQLLFYHYLKSQNEN